MKKYLFIPFLLMFSCDSTAPSQGSFSLDPPVFTGDPVPCEFSLEWENAGAEYELYRSTGAGIETDPSEAVLLCTTDETEWRDSDSLRWGTEYYYAVRADENGWSNEVSALTPPSPYPPACELFMEKTGFTDCRLEWTEAEEDFSSYALLRNDYSIDFLYTSLADTLFVSYCSDSTSFTDHFASASRTSYYAVAVTDADGLSSLSNPVSFSPSGEIPWRITFSRTVYGFHPRNYQISSSPEVMTGARFYNGYSCSMLFDADDYSVICENSIDPTFISVLSSGDILVSYQANDGYRLSLFSSDFSREICSRSLAPMTHGVELDRGFLVGGTTVSFFVEKETLETQMTFGFGFSGGFLSEEGSRVFLKSGSGVIVLDANSLSVSGSIPGYFTSVQEGSDGGIYCVNSQRMQVYHPQTLSMIREFVFPEPASTAEAAVLPPDCRNVYVPVMENGELVIRVWDTITGETTGTVRSVSRGLTSLWDFLPSPSGSCLWFLGSEADGTQAVFRISL